MENEKLEKIQGVPLDAPPLISPSERFRPQDARANRAIFVAHKSRQIPVSLGRMEEAKLKVDDNTSPPLFEILEADISREKVIAELVAALGSNPEEKAQMTRRFAAALGVTVKEDPKVVPPVPSQMRQPPLESQAEHPVISKIRELTSERATLLRMADRLSEQLEQLRARI